MIERELIFSTDKIMITFRTGLSRVMQVAEMAQVPWREPDNYDNWDRIAIALYETFVADFVSDAKECQGWKRIPKYDSRLSMYDANQSYICCESDSLSSPFVCFETREHPFDTCLFAQIDLHGNRIGEFRKPFSLVRWQIYSGRSDRIFTNHVTVDL